MSSSSKKSNSAVVVFVAVFVAVGLAVAGSRIPKIVTWYQTQQWDKHQAQIESVEREVHNPGKSEDRWSEIHADYEYEVNGVQYLGHVVSKDPRALSDQYEKTRELEKLIKNGEPHVCYVNPNNPQDAVLYRELNLIGHLAAFVFGALFILLPGCFGAVAIHANREAARREELCDEHPNEPWLWRDDWASGVIACSGVQSVIIPVVFAVAWNLFAFIAVLAILRDMKDSVLPLLGALGLGVVPGLGLIGLVAYQFARTRRFGKSTLQLGTLPGVIGGPFTGVARTESELDSISNVRATLVCNEIEVRGHGKNRSVTTTPLWQDVKVIAPQSAADSTSSIIPIQFEIPFTAKQVSEDDAARSSIAWELQLTSEQPGVDYKANFVVPVFKTADSSPAFQMAESSISRFEQVQTVADEYRRVGIRRRELDGGLEVIFPMFRNIVNSLMVTFATAFIWAVVIGFGYAAWHENELGLGAIVGLGFGGLLGVLLLCLCLGAWFRKTKIRVSSDGVAIRSGLFGIGREQRFATDEIKSVLAVPYGVRHPDTPDYDTQGRQIPMYDICLKTHDDKTLRFGKRVVDQKAPHAIAADIANAIGIEAEFPKDVVQSPEAKRKHVSTL